MKAILIKRITTKEFAELKNIYSEAILSAIYSKALTDCEKVLVNGYWVYMVPLNENNLKWEPKRTKNDDIIHVKEKHFNKETHEYYQDAWEYRNDVIGKECQHAISF